MKRILKGLLYVVIGLFVVLLIAINFTIGWRPFIGPKARPLTMRRFQATPARLERGKILAHVKGCVDCHTPRQWSAPGMPFEETKLAAGGEMPFDDLPGKVFAPNLTPDPETGAGTWSDDALARAMREGIGHDGRTLFPLMPYQYFRSLSDEDMASIIVYLRSLPAIRNAVPRTEIIFPVKYLIRSVPQPVGVVREPDKSNLVAWGEYLVNTASCSECHTPMVGHDRPASLKFAGGFHLKGYWGDVVTANITPDASGISYYDDALFIQALHTGKVKARILHPIMPYNEYQYIPDDELKAMFAYLKTVKPVRHRVDNSLPPTYCKVCQSNHGAGDQN